MKHEEIHRLILAPETRVRLLRGQGNHFPGLSHDLIEDGLQEGLTKAVLAVDKLLAVNPEPSEKDVLRWLKRVVSNAIIDQYRKDAAWRGVPARARRTRRRHGLDQDEIEPLAKVIVWSECTPDEAEQDPYTYVEEAVAITKEPPPIITTTSLVPLIEMDQLCLRAAILWIIYTGSARGWTRFVDAYFNRPGLGKDQARRVRHACMSTLRPDGQGQEG